MELTHLDKLYWPGITKGELIDYYRAVAPILLPYLKNRPLAMHRFPNGIDGDSFFQKDVKDPPSFAKTVKIAHKERDVHYLLVQNLNTLLYVANLGSIELHTFHSTINHLTKPDYLILDLDPHDVPFSALIEVAQVMHELLEEKKIPNNCKTSGKTGLHIYVPLGAKYTYAQSRAFALEIAKRVVEELPTLTSIERSPEKRKKKIYIDTQQNTQGALLVAPYSVRACPGATVSTPLDWKEVKKGLDPKEFTIKTVPARVKKKGDLFKEVLTCKGQSLSLE